MNKALFLDRDGVINVEIGYVHKIEEFRFIDGVFAACRAAQRRGYRLVVITNQSGIARGYYGEREFHELNDWMVGRFAGEGVEIAASYFCPYHPTKGQGAYLRDAECRKPNPGMILQARDELDLDLAHSILVGDKLSDVQAGRRAGVGYNILVRSGHELPDEPEGADLVLGSIADLERWLENNR